MPTSSYKTTDVNAYLREIEGMLDWELQEHAQKVGVLPTANRRQLITRLEDRFLRDKKRFVVPKTTGAQGVDPSIREQAERILRGRR